MLTYQQAFKQVDVSQQTMEAAHATRVLFVIDTLEVGGAEQSLLDLVTRLRTIEPIVCHLYAGETLKPRFESSGIAVRSLGIRKKYGFISAYRKLKALVEQEQPQLVVASLTRSELVSRIVCKQLQVPLVGSFVSDLYGKSYNQTLSRKAQWGVAFFKWLNKLTAGYCTGFIANSEAIRQSNAIQLGVPPAKIQVINRGRDSQRFIYQPRTIIPGKPMRFLHVGRLVPVKGQRDLILAFQYFLRSHPGALLDIAGEGPERAALTALIASLQLTEQVRLLGNRNDVPALLQEYDCFVFPSYSEGFSGAVIEAMMSGIPVLASDIPANKEVIQHLETGYLFASGDVPGLAAALTWLGDHRQQAIDMAAEAQAHAVAHFELGKITAQLETYLQTITGIAP